MKKLPSKTDSDLYYPYSTELIPDSAVILVSSLVHWYLLQYVTVYKYPYQRLVTPYLTLYSDQLGQVSSVEQLRLMQALSAAGLLLLKLPPESPNQPVCPFMQYVLQRLYSQAWKIQ